jgi:hypothetical protein
MPMKPLKGIVWGCALALLAASGEPCRAAWCNAFQVCCNTCGCPAPDPCCNPCPQQCCTTQYVQRSYYQPVTCYQTRTYYEPVTTYKTSYYYEPVCSYRYSCYYDPCTCSYQQVATPVTSYRVKSQCCPVTSYLQRCCMVPVTTYQQSCYWEPVTTCSPAPAPCCPSTPAAPAAPTYPTYPTPGVGEQRSFPPAGVGETREGAPTTGKGFDAYKQSPPPPLPPTSYNRQLAPQFPAVPKAPAAPPTVRLERIVSLPAPGVEGQVIRSDKEPLSGAKVMFVNADRQGDQQSVTADGKGQFRADLTAGHWLVYLHKTDGSLDFQSKIEVRGEETQRLTLLGR